MKHDLDIAIENPEATLSCTLLDYARRHPQGTGQAEVVKYFEEYNPVLSPCVLVAKPLSRWGAWKERLAALLYRLADWLSEDL
jgi:hypothetical protein